VKIGGMVARHDPAHGSAPRPMTLRICMKLTSSLQPLELVFDPAIYQVSTDRHGHCQLNVGRLCVRGAFKCPSHLNP